MSAPGWSATGVGCVSQHALRQTPPLLTESQTPVKTLPWPNFVAAGKNDIRILCNIANALCVQITFEASNLLNGCNREPDSAAFIGLRKVDSFTTSFPDWLDDDLDL